MLKSITIIKILILIAIVAILMAVFIKRGPAFKYDEAPRDPITDG